MRTLHVTIGVALLAISQLVVAEPKIDAIDDVVVTPCLTTRVKFNQNALKPYQANQLHLKIEDEANDNTYVEIIKQKNGLFIWEKAIPVGENLTFTVLKDEQPISYAFSKETRNQLVKAIAPTQMAQSDNEESVFVRGLSAGANVGKKSIPISIEKDMMNKELLVVITSEEGKLLWQHYGTAENKPLNATIPSDVSYTKPHIIASNTICPQ